MGMRWIGAGAGAMAATAVAVALSLGGGHRASAHSRATATLAPVRRSAVSPHATRVATTAANEAAHTATHADAPGTKGAAAHRENVAAEAPDPEEAKSFPVSGTIHHANAATPRTAAEEVVAPGAPSDAEVQAELHRMHVVQQAARHQETATMSTVPGGDSVGGDGQIPIPQGIPEVVQRVIAGANAIADFPYVYGGGHASFVSNSYDCSGSVSYALAAGGLLSAPETSGALESWGEPGPGKWITIYANAGHVYMYVNIGGRWMRFDTVGRSGPYASRWQPEMRSNEGFVARHPPNL
ncbi:MAG TPA: hypothetical protein VMU32_04020 [Solirubrobacteraceae bacterium]|nr:hypothetical protein [Solirubrobacteraceae bacterium]